MRCSYTNTTKNIQIAKIVDFSSHYLERVVFPGTCLLFEASPQARLEIHTGTMVSSILTDKIPCERLAL